jgi:hypothetical protein
MTRTDHCRIKEIPNNATTKSHGSIPDQFFIAMRRSEIEITGPHPNYFCAPARYCSADDLFSTHTEHPFEFD